MPAGFQIINDHGTVMFDENFPALAIREKGTVSVGPVMPQALLPEVSFSRTNHTTPYIAYRSPVYAAAFCTQNYSNPNQWDFSFIAESATTISYWIIDVPLNLPGTTHGLQVFNAAGVLCFDALWEYARFEGIHSGILNGTPNWRGSVTYPYTLAVLPLQQSGGIEYDGYTEPGPVLETGNYRERQRRIYSAAKMTGNTIQYELIKPAWGDYNEYLQQTGTPFSTQVYYTSLLLRT